MSTGGVPIDVVLKKPHPARPELVVLCDVSGSVAGFSHFTLLLVHALRQQFSRVRVFAFIDTTDEVTELFGPDADLAVAAQAHEALLGQHAQNARLGRERHVGDLVEIKRPAVGELEQTRAHQLAIGFLAEQLLFEPLGSNACRIDDHEGVLGASAPRVEQAGCDFLARTARPADDLAAEGDARLAQPLHFRRDRRGFTQRRLSIRGMRVDVVQQAGGAQLGVEACEFLR